MSKVTSFTSPAKEFRLTSKMSRLLDVTSGGKRVVLCMMNKGWRCDTTMIWGKKDGAPNIIGRGWGNFFRHNL
jgi:hypothetical protein